jgi:hypothetical protein
MATGPYLPVTRFLSLAPTFFTSGVCSLIAPQHLAREASRRIAFMPPNSTLGLAAVLAWERDEDVRCMVRDLRTGRHHWIDEADDKGCCGCPRQPRAGTVGAGRWAWVLSLLATVMGSRTPAPVAREAAAGRPLFDLYPSPLDHFGPFHDLSLHEWIDVLECHV